jgi:hypothetical protein
MKPALIVLLLALARPLKADTVKFVFSPPVADTHSSVDVMLHGIWPTGNGPEFSGVTISGSQIAILLISHTGNTPSPYVVPWSSTAHLGILAGGVYDVSATITLPLGNALPADHATLIVRDANFAYVVPNVVPIGGGQAIVGLTGQPDPFHRDAIAMVSIDGGPFFHPDSGIYLTLAPRPTAGTVAMKVQTVKGVTYDVPAAITFFDPVAAPDPALFEPLLFPVSFSGDGGFFSRWSTVNTLHMHFLTSFRTPVPCDACDTSQPMVLKTTNAPSGLLLWVVRGTGFSAASSNVRELTHGAMTRLPVLREKDLFRFGARFVEVPRAAHSRTTLRVWILGSTNSETLNVIASSRARSATLSPAPTATRTANDQPLFVSLDISALLDQVDDGGPISVNIRSNAPDPDDERTWALLSVTDNATQQMTIVAADPLGAP